MSKTVRKIVRQSDIALSGLTRGNRVGLKFILTTPTPITLGRFVVKAALGDPDPGIVSKLVTPTPGADGQIIDSGMVNGVAVVLFILSHNDTALFTAGQKYRWDCEVLDESNNPSTPRGGTIEFQERVRTAVG